MQNQLAVSLTQEAYLQRVFARLKCEEAVGNFAKSLNALGVAIHGITVRHSREGPPDEMWAYFRQLVGLQEPREFSEEVFDLHIHAENEGQAEVYGSRPMRHVTAHGRHPGGEWEAAFSLWFDSEVARVWVYEDLEAFLNRA